MSLLTHARPLSEVLKDEKTPPRIKSLLAEIQGIKSFGEKRGLKATRNYTEYVKLDRSAAVWVVSACEELQFKAKQWSFPIVGSFPYLGWFDLEAARDYAKELKLEGWDVDVRGAGAYSTLGWFRDAILSSMLSSGPEALGNLVNVVLHESVHATLYIEGQSYFNESLANYIADQLTTLYLESQPELARKAYQEEVIRGQEIGKCFHSAYQRLEDLYQSSRTGEEKKAQKKKIYTELQTEIDQKFKIKREFNNATLIQYKTYHTGYPDFDELFRRCGGGAPEDSVLRMLKSLQILTPRSFPDPQMSDLGLVLRKVTCIK